MSTHNGNGLSILFAGRYLRQKRIACDLLVTDMARCLHVDPCTVWRWETERVPISPQMLYEYLTTCRIGLDVQIGRLTKE